MRNLAKLGYEGFPVISTLARKMCGNKLLHHHLTLTTYQLMCQNLCIVQRIQNLQKYLHIFWGIRLPQNCWSQKSPKNGSFLFESVLILELCNIKSQFYIHLLVLFGHDMKKMCPSLLWTNNSYFICGQASMLNLDKKIKVSFESQNVKKKKWILPLHPFF